MAHPSLWLYRILLHLGLPIAVPAIAIRDRLTGKRRPPFTERLLRTPPPVPTGCLWLQAVSVGEVELTRRLVAELGRVRDAPPVVVTATTATGLELARRTLSELATVLPCPLDLPGPLSRLFDAASPRGLALVETELWPEMLHQAHLRSLPVAVVNARLSPTSFTRYRRVRSLLRPLLEPLTMVLARDESDAERFVALGVAADRVRVVGNVKYDLEPDATPLEWEGRLRSLAGGRPVVVAGSTMEGEEQLVVEAVRRLQGVDDRPLLVLAPRHPERFDSVAEMLRRRGVTIARRSDSGPWPDDAEVLLLDTIGELGRAYRLGSAAFIGGSLVPTGGHNPLEPAVWGVPVATGSHVFNFGEVYAEMTAAGGAVVVEDADGLAAVWSRWLSEPDAARRAGARGRRVVEGNRGATGRTVAALLEMTA